MGITTDGDAIGGARLLITYGEAAAALAVSPRYLRTLVYQGVLPSVRLGRLRRIAVADLCTFIDALRDGSLWTPASPEPDSPRVRNVAARTRACAPGDAPLIGAVRTASRTDIQAGI